MRAAWNRTSWSFITSDPQSRLMEDLESKGELRGRRWCDCQGTWMKTYVPLVSKGKKVRGQRDIWSSVVGLLAELCWTLPWLLLRVREVEGKTTDTVFLHNVLLLPCDRRKDSVLCASGHIPGQFLAKVCNSCKISAQIPGESGQTYGGEIHCWEEKGGCWLGKPYQTQEIHSAEKVWKLCEC